MTCVIVVGKERSGTSVTAGVMQKLGVNMTTSPLENSQHNPTGYYEDTRLTAALDEFLESIAGEKPTYDKQLTSSLYDYLDDRMSEGLWGFKDPRFIHVSAPIIGYLRERQQTVLPIIVSRHPLASARSLAKYGYTDQQAIQIVKSWDYPMLWTEGVLESHLPMRIEYEDLIADPTSVVTRLSEYVFGEAVGSVKRAVEHVDPALNRNG